MMNQIDGQYDVDQFRIESIIAAYPKTVLDLFNPEPDKRVARIARSIGIFEKRICTQGLIFTDLCIGAIHETMERNNHTPDDIDAIIVCTQSSEYLIPGTAVLLQDLCGFSKNTLAFDVNLGCSAYPYGVFLGHSLLLAGLRRVYVVVGDQSFSGDTKDVGASILFGDCATVTSLTLGQLGEKAYFSFGTDGSGYKSLYIPHGGKRRPVTVDSFDYVEQADGTIRRGIDVVLDGPEILKFSLSVVPQQVANFLEHSNLNIGDIDALILHQANKMINDTIRKKLKGTVEQFPSTLAKFANTSSASIPLTAVEMSKPVFAKPSSTVFMCGFGIGLSWASMAIKTSGKEYLGAIEIDVPGP